ncbi:hypothetical protein ACX3OW_21205 [Devosia sp. A449]
MYIAALDEIEAGSAVSQCGAANAHLKLNMVTAGRGLETIILVSALQCTYLLRDGGAGHYELQQGGRTGPLAACAGTKASGTACDRT